MSDPEDGILAIALSDSDDESAGAAREARTGQSAGAFEAVKRGYQVKVEEGEVRLYLHLLAGVYLFFFFFSPCEG